MLIQEYRVLEKEIVKDCDDKLHNLRKTYVEQNKNLTLEILFLM